MQLPRTFKEIAFRPTNIRPLFGLLIIKPRCACFDTSLCIMKSNGTKRDNDVLSAQGLRNLVGGELFRKKLKRAETAGAGTRANFRCPAELGRSKRITSGDCCQRWGCRTQAPNEPQTETKSKKRGMRRVLQEGPEPRAYDLSLCTCHAPLPSRRQPACHAISLMLPNYC